MNELNERLRDEQVDDAVNKVREFGEKWNNRLTLDNLRLAERYLKVEIEILVHLLAGRETSKPNHFCAIMCNEISRTGRNRANGRFDVFSAHEFTSSLNDVDIGVSVSKAPSTQTIGRNEQEAMFVDVVKLLEYSEQFVPTLIRLDSFDSVYRARRDAIYYSSASGVLELGAGICKRESGLASGEERICNDKLPSQMVKGASQVLNRFSGDQRELNRNLAINLNSIDEYSGLRVGIAQNFVWVDFFEGTNPGVQITDVLFGPFYLCSDIGQSV
jgi:hypothetical protein